MAISNTYTGNGSETSFAVSFPYVTVSSIKAYVDGVLETQWTFDTSTSTLTFDSAPGNGIAILIERDTDITEPVTTFSDGAVFIADGLNNQVNQLLYAIEEVNDKVDNLPSGGGGGGGGASNVPDATAGNQFIVSDVAGSHDWQLKTVAQVQTLLGVTNNIPAPVTDRFLVTPTDSATYTLQTAATIKSRLGIGASIPTPNNQSNFFMTTNGAGNAYQLTPVDTVKSTLGLGTAAFRNTGTSSNNVPLLIPPAAGAVGALPIISGENLTNVQKPIKFMVYQVMLRANPSTARNLPSSGAAQPWLSTTTSAVIEEAVGCQNMMTADPWVSIVTQTPNKWNLRDAGLYRIECDQIIRRASTTASEEIRMRLELPDDSIITEPEYRHWSWAETRPFWFLNTADAITSIRGEWMIRTNASNQVFWFEVRKSTTTANNVAISRTGYGAGDNIDYMASVVKIWKMG